jgi:hypothetical protein
MRARRWRAARAGSGVRREHGAHLGGVELLRELLGLVWRLSHLLAHARALLAAVPLLERVAFRLALRADELGRRLCAPTGWARHGRTRRKDERWCVRRVRGRAAERCAWTARARGARGVAREARATARRGGAHREVARVLRRLDLGGRESVRERRGHRHRLLHPQRRQVWSDLDLGRLEPRGEMKVGQRVQLPEEAREQPAELGGGLAGARADDVDAHRALFEFALVLLRQPERRLVLRELEGARRRLARARLRLAHHVVEERLRAGSERGGESRA